MITIPVRRSVLADILDRVRQDLADRVPPEEIERRLAGNPDPENPGQICFAYNTFGWVALEPLKACEHNAYIDNCSRCAPRWGWTGPKVVAK